MGKGIATAGQHNYEARIEELLQATPFLDVPEGGVYRLVVVHADDCRFFEGGWCNCQPDFELQDIATSTGRGDNR